MRALFIGRFQPFHLGHVELLKSVLRLTRLQQVVIAIANVEQARTIENPFSFAERAFMVRESISELIPTVGNRISVVPLPYETPPDRFAPSILDQFGPFDLMVSNNDWVRAQFQNISGIRLQPKFFFHRDQYRGGRIRSLMAKGDDSWKATVAGSVAQYLSKKVGRIFNQVISSQKHASKQNLVNSIMPHTFSGEVISGMHVAARYVETPHFFQALAIFLGAEPFLGTLNIQLRERSDAFFKYLRSREPLQIPPKYEENVSFWNVDCYPAILQANQTNEKKSYVLALDFGTQKSEERVVELVAHPHLRKMLNLQDGNTVVIFLL